MTSVSSWQAMCDTGTADLYTGCFSNAESHNKDMRCNLLAIDIRLLFIMTWFIVAVVIMMYW